MANDLSNNMTEGNSLKHIVQFALPLLVGNVLQQTYNMVDAAIVGRKLGSDALASVGASNSVQFLILGFCIGICCGFGIPVAQRFGAKDYKGMRNYIFHSILVAVAAAVILTLACTIFCTDILRLLKTPEDILQGAYQYLFILFLGIPFNLLYNLEAAILRAVGDSKTPFWLLAISTSLNIILDVVFIVSLHMGCGGAALATVIAQALSGIMGLVFILVKGKMLIPKKEECRFNGGVLRNIVVMGVPMGLQYSITAIGCMVMQAANNNLGSVYVSGFTAGMKIKQFAMCPFDAVATAVSTFCGQNLGAVKFDRIKRGIRQGVAIGVCYGLFAGSILIFFGRPLSGIFIETGKTAVSDAATKYLFCMGFFMWALGILNTLRMTTQGLGYSGRAIFSGVVEMFARIIVSFCFVPHFGYDAICFCDQSAWLSATIYIIPTCLLCIRTIRKKLDPALNRE